MSRPGLDIGERLLSRVLAACVLLAGCGDGGNSTPVVLNITPAAVPNCIAALVRPGELAQSPRSDEEMEMLARQLSPGFTADQLLYERLMLDRAAIASGWPEIARAFSFASRYAQHLLVRIASAATIDAVLAGTRADWNCLNDGLGPTSATRNRQGTDVIIWFSGPQLTLERVSPLYAALPGVSSAIPDYYISAADIARANTGVTPVGEIWHYVLWQDGDCDGCAPAGYYYFTSFFGGGIAFVDSWRPGGNSPEPAWFGPYWRQAKSRLPVPL